MGRGLQIIEKWANQDQETMVVFGYRNLKFLILSRARFFTSQHLDRPEVHPVSNPVSAGSCFPGRKAAGA
jgi:hypothetical protein